VFSAQVTKLEIDLVNAKQELGEALNQIFELTNENQQMEREAVALSSRNEPGDTAIVFNEEEAEEYKTPQPAPSDKFAKAFKTKYMPSMFKKKK
jgi:regulator of replication initiation timing